MIDEWGSREEYIWRVLKQHVVYDDDALEAIGPKPTEEEPFFTVTFSDGHRMQISMTNLIPLRLE